MMVSGFFAKVIENEKNINLINWIKDYCSSNLSEIVYLVTAPLGEKKYSYDYQDSVIVLLSPKRKIVFIDLCNNKKAFDNYCEEFLYDVYSIADKFEYTDYIKRPKKWEENNIYKVVYEDNIQFILEDSIDVSPNQRVSELIISLIIGSVNDLNRVGIEPPTTLLDRVKRNIILFDGDQTRFIYQDFENKLIRTQGLAGTGKTELLLHKLKELYLKEDKVKIFFTCHNITLANTLRFRVPEFFNFMKVEKQIEWDRKLWVAHAWGSGKDPSSGLFSYLCDFYSVPFLRWSPTTNYEKIFQHLDKYIEEKIKSQSFEYALDYIMVDEMQDFPQIFFDICVKVTKKKVFVVGDIFQNIYDNVKENTLDVDVILNKCYRTDPRTLMFSHALGLGLYEKKINWFSDDEWKMIGYNIKMIGNDKIELTRDPIRRFENINAEEYSSCVIRQSTRVDDVVSIIREIKNQHSDVKPDDIAIIILIDNKSIYQYIDILAGKIYSELGMYVNRGHENKCKVENTVFISNPHNAKGLEFPFVICLTSDIQDDIKSRNMLYTMLTRSFIQSYLCIEDISDDHYKLLNKGLQKVLKENVIETTVPTKQEVEEITKTLRAFKKKPAISYEDFLKSIFEELNVTDKHIQETLIESINMSMIPKFEKEATIEFFRMNLKYIK